MEIFKNKFLVKLIASICLFLTLFNFSGTTKVYADSWGGPLMRPIASIMTAIGDAIMDILHEALRKQDTAIIKISGLTNWQVFWRAVAVVVVAIVVAIVFIVAAAATQGLSAAVVGVVAGGAFTFAMPTVGLGLTLVGAGVGIWQGIKAGKAWFPNDIYLPVFTISAEQIFANKVPLFDVNFFSPMKDQEVQTGTKELTKYKVTGRLMVLYDVYDTDPETTTELTFATNADWRGKLTETELSYINQEEEGFLIEPEWENLINSTYKYECLVEDICENQPPTDGDDVFTLNEILNHLNNNNKSKTKEIFLALLLRIENILKYRGIPFDEDYRDNVAAITSPEKNNPGMTSNYREGAIYFCYNYSESKYMTIRVRADEELETEQVPVMETLTSTAKQLKNVISSWYFILRNIALLVLMLLLIYSGIRIVIGSTAGEKAKYKERIMDWLVAMCLIMVMHYIMVFAVEIVGKITELIRDDNIYRNAAYIPLTENQWGKAEEMDWSGFGGVNNIFVDDPDAESGKALIWQTDLVGLFRLQSQFENEGTAKWVGYSFCYVVLVLLTLFFTFTYIKRILYMAFLTIIAPLVAMTYPIDKITDGKAQAFNSWLKEYIFNLMIQPLHLLLYTILVTSAFQLASTNPVYALVSLGFIMPAEKLMRSFFGFEKAKTPGLLGGAAGAAIAMSGLQGLLKQKPHGGKSEGGSGKSGDTNKVRFSNKNKGNAMDDITGMTQKAKGNAGANSGQTVVMQAPRQRAQQTGSPVNANLSVNTGSSGGYNINPGAADDEDANGFIPGAGDNDFDDSEMFADTTLGMDDWEHDGFGIDNLGDAPGSTSNGNISIPANNNEQEDDSDLDKVEDTKKHKRSIMRAIGAVTLGVGKQAAVGVLRGVHPLRFAGKLAAGATAATAGLLIGTASGDPSKAFQYTTAGAMGGSALASSLSGRKGLDAETIRQEAEMAYFGSDYKAELIRRQKQEFQTNSENINYLRQVMGVSHSEAKQILETTGSECFDNGITDIKDVATIHQLTHQKDKKDEMTFKKAAAARTYAKRRLGGVDADQMTQDTVEEYKKRWTREFRDRYNISEQDARELADKSFDAAIRFNKTYNGLTKFSE